MTRDAVSSSDDSAIVVQETAETCQTDVTAPVFSPRAALQRWQPRVSALAVTFLASDVGLQIITNVGGSHNKHGS